MNRLAPPSAVSWRNIEAFGILLAFSALSFRCGLSSDVSKHSCVTDGDCLDTRRCVAGLCREQGAGGKGSATIDIGEQGGAAGDPHAPAFGGSPGAAPGVGGDGSAGNGESVQECPEMVKVPQGFCIDSTEVTRRSYRAWLDATPPIPINSGCEANETLEPSCAWSNGSELLPATCIDWCDAKAYCQGLGKRLCGDVAGGAVAYASFTDAAHDEWYAACSLHDTSRHPYGDVFVEGQCVDLSVAALNPVATFPACQAPLGPYHCIFDLIGNAWEWEDCCESHLPASHCRMRGGSIGQGNPYCAMDGFNERLASGANIGFRCCADDCP